MDSEDIIKLDKPKKKVKKFVEGNSVLSHVLDDSAGETVKKKKKKKKDKEMAVLEEDNVVPKSPKKAVQILSGEESDSVVKSKKKNKKLMNDENLNANTPMDVSKKKKLDAILSSPTRSVTFSKNLISPSKEKDSTDVESTPKKSKKHSLKKIDDENHYSPGFSELSSVDDEGSPKKRKVDLKENDENVEEASHPPDQGSIEAVIGWPKEDVLTLIQRIKHNIPNNDTLKYNSRVKKLDWKEVKFGSYSEEDCLEKWLLIEKRMRGYRILSEVVQDAVEWINKPWQDFYRGIKKNRHPEMPKRPLSSYMLFYMAKKDKIAEQNPGISMLALSKLVSQKYHTLSVKKKAKYTRMASKLSEEYHERMVKFLEEHPEEAPKKLDSKKSKDPYSSLPKPKTPFKLFLEDKKNKIEETEGFDLQAFTLQIKENWKNLNLKKKTFWIQWALEEEKKYIDGINQIHSAYPDAPLPKHKSVVTKEEKILLERAEGRPEKPPNSAYGLFSRMMLKDPDFISQCQDNPKEKLKKISELWAKLHPEDKQVYAQRTKFLMEQYKLEYATYLESLPEEKRAEEEEKNKRKPARKAPEKEDGGSKLKQLSLLDSFKKVKKKVQEVYTDTEEEESEEEHKSAKAEPDESETVKRLLELEPSPPPKTAEELYKRTHSGLEEGAAERRWAALSEKARSKYSSKLLDMKQAYLISFKEFLQSLSAEELKLFSAAKANSSSMNKSRQEEESSSSSSYSSDSDSEPAIRAINNSQMREDTDSSSDD